MPGLVTMPPRLHLLHIVQNLLNTTGLFRVPTCLHLTASTPLAKLANVMLTNFSEVTCHSEVTTAHPTQYDFE